MPFYSELSVDYGGGYGWVIDKPLKYLSLSGLWVVVKPGFTTDLASIPRIFTPLFPKHGPWTPAAVVHDWLYANRIGKRKDADRIFKEAMKELGVPGWRRWVMWAAVRAGGWTYWRD